jgi:hypothetical protein
MLNSYLPMSLFLYIGSEVRSTVSEELPQTPPAKILERKVCWNARRNEESRRLFSRCQPSKQAQAKKRNTDCGPKHEDGGKGQRNSLAGMLDNSDCFNRLLLPRKQKEITK